MDVGEQISGLLTDRDHLLQEQLNKEDQIRQIIRDTPFVTVIVSELAYRLKSIGTVGMIITIEVGGTSFVCIRPVFVSSPVETYYRKMEHIDTLFDDVITELTSEDEREYINFINYSPRYLDDTPEGYDYILDQMRSNIVFTFWKDF